MKIIKVYVFVESCNSKTWRSAARPVDTIIPRLTNNFHLLSHLWSVVQGGCNAVLGRILKLCSGLEGKSVLSSNQKNQK